jgi:hypothetical protein
MATYKKARREVSAPAKPDGECLIPPELPKAELHKLLFRQSDREAQEIKDYVDWQSHGKEKALHAKKVASERVFGLKFDVGRFTVARATL